MSVETGSKEPSTTENSVPKVAWIVGVGAAAGLGAALARRFASAGLIVALTGRTAERVRATAGQIFAAGGRASAIAGDASSVEDMRRLAAEVRALGALHVAVFNAGNAV